MATPHLGEMPTEIILQIVQDLPLNSKHNICLVNKRFYVITNPELYTSAVAAEHPGITVLAARDGKLNTLKLAALSGANLNCVYWVPVPSWATPEYASLQKHADTGFGISWATPLHMAAAEGHYNIVKWLLSQGVDIDAPGKLLCGCRSASQRYIIGDRYLMWCEELGVAGTWTPLHLAICRGRLSVASFLIHHGASMSVRYPRHERILRTHGVGSLFSSCSSEIKYHFGRNNARGESDSDGYSIEDGESNIEEYGNDYEDQRFEDNVLAIHTAAASGQKAIVRLLHSLQVDINSPDGAGANAAFYALDSPNPDMLRYCLALGANPTTPVSMEGNWELSGDVGNLAEYAVGVLGERPAFVCYVLRCLAEHEGFWQIGNRNSSSSSIVMTIDRLIAGMSYHLRKDIRCRDKDMWIADFIRQGIAAYESANKLKDLTRDINKLFWFAITQPRYGVNVLDMIANEFYTFSLNDEIDGTSSFFTANSIHHHRHEELGTSALRWLLREDSYGMEEELYTPTTTLEKLTWLLEQGADPIGRCQGCSECPVLRGYLNRLRQSLASAAEFGLWTWDLSQIINLLGKYGGWGRNASDIEKTVHSYRVLLREVQKYDHWRELGRLESVTLPGQFSD